MSTTTIILIAAVAAVIAVAATAGVVLAIINVNELEMLSDEVRRLRERVTKLEVRR